MLRDPFFCEQPPKSTGTDYFNLSWIKKNVSNCKSIFFPEDIQATLTELTAQVIFKELRSLKVQKKGIYICGGGIHNSFLIKRFDLSKITGSQGKVLLGKVWEVN